MRSLSTLCKSLPICFTSSTVKSNALLADFRPVKMGKGDFTAAATAPSVPFFKEMRGVARAALRYSREHCPLSCILPRGGANQKSNCML